MAEDSIFKEENEIDSHKLLYKYQYAFLHMQKSFTSLFKAVKAFEERAKLKFLRL